MLVNLNQVLRDAQKRRYAVGLFNTIDTDMLQAAIDAAEAQRSPIIIGTAEILKAEPVSPEELRARISSKRGTTEAAVETMLGAGFEIAVTAGYIRAVQKSDAMTSTFDAE